MSAEVFFIEVNKGEDPSSIAKKAKYLYDRSGAGKRFQKGELVAVKTHFGESDNTTYLHPHIVKGIINKLKQQGTVPFLTETSTLYRGKRSNAIDHIAVAYEHGFGFENMQVPIIMADGLFGDAEISVGIGGKHYKQVNIASEVAKIKGLMVLSHFKGHIATGFGAAIKNVGMGLASRRGKLKQHSVMSPQIDEGKCTACGVCIKWCPQDTISMVEGNGRHAFIHKENCIGCGECLAVCQFDAVLFDWNRESSSMQEMMAEHTAGVLKAIEGNAFFFNFLINITKDCDCMNGGPFVSQDIGIIAGDDVVAVDQASYDIFRDTNGKAIQDLTYPNVDPLFQVRHAQTLGLGSMEYKLVRVR